MLLSPKSNVSSLYYKRKLIIHNFTICHLKTKDAYCFLWNESEGAVGSNEFSSIIYDFIEQELRELNDKESIIFYSDGCTGQNRNSTLSNALLHLAIEKKVTIIQKYLERGHTQMEADAMHSLIERRLKNKKINVPADYIDVCLSARE